MNKACNGLRFRDCEGLETRLVSHAVAKDTSLLKFVLRSYCSLMSCCLAALQKREGPAQAPPAWVWAVAAAVAVAMRAQEQGALQAAPYRSRRPALLWATNTSTCQATQC